MFCWFSLLMSFFHVIYFTPAGIHSMNDCVHYVVRFQVYPLHSTVTLEEQNEVFLVPVAGYRKVGLQ